MQTRFTPLETAFSISTPLETASIDVPLIIVMALFEGWYEIHVFFGDQKHHKKKGESQTGQDRTVS